MTPTASINEVVQHLLSVGGGRQAPKTFGRFRLVADAESAAAVFRNVDVFLKDYGAVTMLGQSRFNTDGEEWRHRRELTQDSYTRMVGHREHIATIFAEAADAVARIPRREGEGVEEVAAMFLAATLRVFLIALGADHDPRELAASFPILRALTTRMQTLSLCGNASIDGAMVLADAQRFRAGVRQYAQRTPAFAQMLDLMFKGYAGSDPDFRPVDEFVMNLFAGIETSAVVLSWSLLMLAADENMQEALREEAGQPGPVPAIERFLNETLRVFAPVPFVSRRVVKSFDLPGREVQLGDYILVSLLGVHRDPDHWSDPAHFNPRRSEFDDRTVMRRAFLPFITGPRVCGGIALARVELVEGMRAILQRLRMCRTSAPLAFNYSLAMRPVLKDRLVVERIA